MAENTTQTTESTEGEGNDATTVADKTFTQEELNSIVQERVARAQEAAEKKFADYPDLKARAEAAEKLEADKLTFEEKTAKELAALRDSLDKRDRDLAEEKIAGIRKDIAHETGVPASQLAAYTTKEDIEARAAELVAWRDEALKNAGGKGNSPGAKTGNKVTSGAGGKGSDTLSAQEKAALAVRGAFN